ncbi:MAG: suppressor of fused domain protein [Planctomycetota bacterium]
MHDPNIIRHEMPDEPGELSIGDGELIDAVCAHFRRYFGETENVFHEILSPHVHVDVHVIPPNEERMYWVLFTTGMAERPMNVPPEVVQAGVPRYAELMMKVEPTWDFSDFEGDPDEVECRYWPLRWMKALARLPHEFDSWLGDGHTIPNEGESPQPYAADTDHCCMLVLHEHGTHARGGFETMTMPGRGEIAILQLVPLQLPEVALKLAGGMQLLYPELRAIVGWYILRKVGFVAIPPDINKVNKNKRFGLF